MKTFIYHIRYWLLLLAGCFIMSGCDELFKLEYESFGTLSPGEFPQNEDDIKAAIVAVYYTFPETYIDTYLNNKPGYILSELTTDEMNTAYGKPWQPWDRFQWKANDGGSFSTCYFSYIKGITNATTAISYVKQSSVGTKDYYIAELRAVRAMLAFNLYDFFGPVPLILNENELTPDPDYAPKRPSKEEYLSFIETELKEVIPVLKTKAQMADADWGHLDKGGALTVLLKLYMMEKQWSKAIETVTEIEKLGYELYDNYSEIFNIANDGKKHKEAIFVIGRLAQNRWGVAWNAYFLPADPKIAKFGDGTPVPSNALTAIWGGLRVPWNMYDKFEEEDTRRKGLIRYYYKKDDILVDYRQEKNAKACGAAPIKFGLDPGQIGERQGNDFIYYRYTDVLLCKAEALNELNGPNTESIDIINRINKRAFGVENKYAVSDFADKGAFRDFILDERFRELYLEGHRRQDLIRHGKFIEKAIEDGWAAEPHHVLFPIPQKAIDENPNLAQNGY